MKAAATSRLALHPDFSAHQRHHLPRDGQAESGAAVLSGGRAVRLSKCLKNPFVIFRRDADAGVRSREVQDTFAVPRLLIRRGANGIAP